MSHKKSSLLKWVASILVIAAIVIAFIYHKEKAVEETPFVIQPLKTIVIKDTFTPPSVFLSGCVSANDTVSLSFEVSGQIIKKNIVKGQKVEKGQILAQLDAQDYENKVKEAQAALNQSKSHYDRISKALENHAVSQEDMSNAKAQYERASANLDIAKKALADTTLTATFDGNIADVFIDTFTTIQARTPVLTLQNVSTIQIDVSVPERYIVNAPQTLSLKNVDQKVTAKATFDTLPDKSFNITFKEFTPSANSLTQTYTASFIMPAPQNLMILPGMSVSVEVKSAFAHTASTSKYPLIPIDLIGIDSTGAHYVWLVEPVDGKIYKVTKCPVKIGQHNGTDIEILSGVKINQRIAAAGIALLTDGQEVSLLSSEPTN